MRNNHGLKRKDQCWRFCDNVDHHIINLDNTIIIYVNLCGHNIVGISPYCERILLIYIITVLSKLTIWWTIFLQYLDNIKVTILWVFHNIVNNIVNILWQYFPPYCRLLQYGYDMLTICGHNVVVIYCDNIVAKTAKTSDVKGKF